jgi:hypothetical protein
VIALAAPKKLNLDMPSQNPDEYQCLTADLVNGKPSFPEGTAIKDGSRCDVVDSPSQWFKYHIDDWYDQSI